MPAPSAGGHKLSDTPSRPSCAGNVLPLPGSRRGGAATKVVTAPLGRGLSREEVIDRLAKVDAALNTVWRNRRSLSRSALIALRPSELA